MTRRDAIFKWLSYSVVLFLVMLFNYYVFPFLPLMAVPALPLEMAVAVGILEGPAAGAGFGIAAGLLLTAATHGSLFWIFLTPLAGWVCGLVAMYILRRDFVGFFPCCLATAAIHEVLEVLPRLFRDVADLPVLLRVAGFELLWTVVFALPVYGMCLFCCKHYGRLFHE